MTAAQLYVAAKKEIPTLEQDLEQVRCVAVPRIGRGRFAFHET